MQVLKHIRYKYGCPCCRQGVRIAPVPPHILPKSKASPSLLAHIVAAKYVDALPLHGQEAQFPRLGVDLPRATMASWMVKLGDCVVPIINLMNEQLLDSPLIQCDETRVQVLSSDKRLPQSTGSGFERPGHRIGESSSSTTIRRAASHTRIFRTSSPNSPKPGVTITSKPFCRGTSRSLPHVDDRATAWQERVNPLKCYRLYVQC
jgi:Transposase IS66 family